MQTPKLQPHPDTSTASNLALMLEMACESFEILQQLIGQSIILVHRTDTSPAFRATGRIQMALAKDFIFHVVRARRICEHGASSLKIDRIIRKKYMEDTAPVVKVRDINEHGSDPTGNKRSMPRMHSYNDGMISVSDTSLAIINNNILVGPVNLHDIYNATDALRKIAGFSRLREMADGSRRAECEAEH